MWVGSLSSPQRANLTKRPKLWKQNAEWERKRRDTERERERTKREWGKVCVCVHGCVHVCGEKDFVWVYVGVWCTYVNARVCESVWVRVREKEKRTTVSKAYLSIQFLRLEKNMIVTFVTFKHNKRPKSVTALLLWSQNHESWGLETNLLNILRCNVTKR